MKKSWLLKRIPELFLIPCEISCAAILLFSASFFFYAKQYVHVAPPKPLTDNQESILTETLDTSYAERRQILSALPYKTVSAKLTVNAESAILVDTATGSILYEKDADEIIPPASMTKLVEMYVVFDAVHKGQVSLDDVVPLPEQCWATNMPRDASLMFLAQGQTVTLRELLLGLSGTFPLQAETIASVAVAYLHLRVALESFCAAHERTLFRFAWPENTRTLWSRAATVKKMLRQLREFASFARILHSEIS